MNQMSRANPLPEPDETEPPLARRARGGRPRAGLIAALDVGSTKIACLIGRIESDQSLRVLSAGLHRARGVRQGQIADLEAAESAIRHAVAQAEELADTQVASVVAALSCGQPASRQLNIQMQLGSEPIVDADLRRVLAAGRDRADAAGRDVIHAVPMGYAVDGTQGISDPRGMYGQLFSARVHVVDAATSALRTFAACLGRCDLEIEAMVAAPYAAGLATLVEDERELGATVIDMGGGTTQIAIFAEGVLQHVDQVPVGGLHVTNDIARGLSTTVAHAERLKTLYGSVRAAPSDDRDVLPVPMVGEDDQQVARMPRSVLVGIIRPRLEETFELVRNRLEASGLKHLAGRRVVLTGGAAGLIGVRELAAEMLEKQVRLGRPLTIRGQAESTAGPAFAAASGLLVWAATDGARLRDLAPGHDRPPGPLGRALAWLKKLA
jgi:cell division protein FtsA